MIQNPEQIDEKNTNKATQNIPVYILQHFLTLKLPFAEKENRRLWHIISRYINIIDVIAMMNYSILENDNKKIYIPP